MSQESEIPECFTCDGSGWDWEAAEACEDCDGTGEHPPYKAMRERAERAEAEAERLRWRVADLEHRAVSGGYYEVRKVVDLRAADLACVDMAAHETSASLKVLRRKAEKAGVQEVSATITTRLDVLPGRGLTTPRIPAPQEGQE